MTISGLTRSIMHALFAATFTGAITACDEEEDLYENIEKLRAIGVATAAVSVAPSVPPALSTQTLTFYAAVPLGETVTAEPWLDAKPGYAAPVPATLVAGSEKYEDYASFRVFSVQATMTVPTEDLLIFAEGQSFSRLRYGLRLRSGSEEELIVGNILAYKPGSPELAWTPHTVDISDPVAGGTVSGKQDITSVINASIDENIRVGWFSGKGKFKNRRAKETEWETEGSGMQSLMVTARGFKSGAFAFKVIDVNVE